MFIFFRKEIGRRFDTFGKMLFFLRDVGSTSENITEKCKKFLKGVYKTLEKWYNIIMVTFALGKENAKECVFCRSDRIYRKFIRKGDKTFDYTA